MTGTIRAHWVLDEDSGATAFDYSGNDYNGTISGAGPQGTGTVTGPFGNSSYNFDGADDQVDVSAASGFTGAFTVSCWARADALGGAAFDREFDGTVSTSLEPNGDGNGNVLWSANYWDVDNTGHVVNAPFAVSTGTWVHILTTRQGENQPHTIYLNGVRGDTDTANTIVDTGDVYLGVYSPGAGGSATEWYNGAVADVRIYDRYMSPQEVQYLYRAGVDSEITFGPTQL